MILSSSLLLYITDYEEARGEPVDLDFTPLSRKRRFGFFGSASGSAFSSVYNSLTSCLTMGDRRLLDWSVLAFNWLFYDFVQSK